MADYLDISLKDICAFGDDINDIEMIEHCGYGVAMANALDIIKEKADFTVSLPMAGHINSLNASVACGVLCYEIARQRQNIPAK